MVFNIEFAYQLQISVSSCVPIVIFSIEFPYQDTFSVSSLRTNTHFQYRVCVSIVILSIELATKLDFGIERVPEGQLIPTGSEMIHTKTRFESVKL